MTFDRGEFPIVHAVTDSAAVAITSFPERAASIMRALGSRGALHLRSSNITGRRFYELANALAEVQRATGCWLIVNDRADIAAAVGARGIQLASHSLGVTDALSVSGEIPVGMSIHSVEEALAAEAAGASWCVAGTVFETPSHEGRIPARVEFVERVANAVSIPVIAIGGIAPANVPVLRRAGAHGVATIRGAAWDSANTGEDSSKLFETRLVAPGSAGIPEPVTRYISAYDADSGSGRDDHPDGQRSNAGTGA